MKDGRLPRITRKELQDDGMKFMLGTLFAR